MADEKCEELRTLPEALSFARGAWNPGSQLYIYTITPCEAQSKSFPTHRHELLEVDLCVSIEIKILQRLNLRTAPQNLPVCHLRVSSLRPWPVQWL